MRKHSICWNHCITSICTGLLALAFVVISPPAAGSIGTSDVSVRASLVRALQQQLPVAVVDAHVIHGIATLTGTVGRLCDRMLAEQIAHSTPGVTTVRDDIDLVVLPLDDKELLNQLSDRLHYSRAEAGFSFPDVKLSVNEGIVTVTGEVNDYLEHAMVRAMITQADGVKGLNDQLHVSENYDADESTRIAVAKALAGEPVEAKVAYGVVYLRGSVPTQEKANALANKVRQVSGAIGVDNELAVNPSPIADLSLTSFINDDVHR